MLRPATLRPLLPGFGGRCARAAARRTLFSRDAPDGGRAPQDLDLNRLNSKRRDYEQNRTAFLAAGAVAGATAFVYTAWKLKQAVDLQREKDRIAVQCDAVVPTETFKTEAGERRKVVLHDEDGREIVPTGNSVIPTFPRLIDVKLPPSPGQTPEQTPEQLSSSSLVTNISDRTGTEFTLVGLGMRTVTFIGIQVYLVGFYVATQDVEKLQHYLVKKVNPLATTLIPSEKDTLRKALRDPAEGEQTWDGMLQDAGCRSVFRIAPVRDTDFHHLRDGFVRAITARSQRDPAYGDDAFGAALKDFRALFDRGSVPKKTEMLLCRDQAGALTVMYDGGRGSGDGDNGGVPRQGVLGTVADERLSRLLWLNYLAGSKVASEAARQNIIEGVMEFVERPVGTVAAQVV